MAIAGKYWQSFGGEMENGKRLPRGWFLCSPSVQFFVELFETFFPTRELIHNGCLQSCQKIWFFKIVFRVHRNVITNLLKYEVLTASITGSLAFLGLYLIKKERVLKSKMLVRSSLNLKKILVCYLCLFLL